MALQNKSQSVVSTTEAGSLHRNGGTISSAKLPLDASSPTTDPEKGMRPSVSQYFERVGTNEVHKDQGISTTLERKESVSSSTWSKIEPWKLALIRFGPLTGLLCLFLVIVCIFAALAILVSSRNSPVNSWTGEPSTYLAICTAVANQSMRYATVQGVAIAWWIRASRGSTLAKLHYDFRSGTSFRGALISGRRMGLLGLACLLSTLVAVDGPLLQRATKVVPSAIVGQTAPLDIKLAQEVPTGFSGYWTHDGSRSAFFNASIPMASGGSIPNDVKLVTASTVMYGVGPSYYADGPIDGVVSGCTGEFSCRATIRAPALARRSCQTTAIPRSPEPIGRETYEALYKGSPAPPLDLTQFLIATYLNVHEENESLVLITAFHEDPSCTGDLKLTTCTLDAAIGEYDTIISNNSISLAAGLPRIIDVANNTRVDHGPGPQRGYHASTLAGVADIPFWEWASQVVVYKYEGIYSEYDVYTNSYLRYGTIGRNCNSFSDPHEDVLESLNNLMFKMGAFAAASSNSSYLESSLDPGISYSTVVQGAVEGVHNIYESNFYWFAAAVVIELIAVAVVAPTFWGWWKLGRSVSFSPLEIARAFEAPLLDGYNHSCSGNDIANAAGDLKVQYKAKTMHLSSTQVMTKVEVRPEQESPLRRSSDCNV